MVWDEGFRRVLAAFEVSNTIKVYGKSIIFNCLVINDLKHLIASDLK